MMQINLIQHYIKAVIIMVKQQHVDLNQRLFLEVLQVMGHHQEQNYTKDLANMLIKSVLI